MILNRSHDEAFFLQSVQIEIVTRGNCPPTLCYPQKRIYGNSSRVNRNDKITHRKIDPLVKECVFTGMNFVSPKLQSFLFRFVTFPECQLGKRSKREGNFSISRFSKVYRSITPFFFRHRIFRCSPCPCLFLEHNSQSQSLIERAKFPARTISKVSPLRKQGQIRLSVDRACFYILSAGDMRA